MDRKSREKVRRTLAKIREDMKTDPALRKAVKKNHVRVLASYNLELPEVIEAYDQRCRGAGGTCPATSMTG